MTQNVVRTQCFVFFYSVSDMKFSIQTHTHRVPHWFIRRDYGVTGVLLCSLQLTHKIRRSCERLWAGQDESAAIRVRCTMSRAQVICEILFVNTR